MVCTKADKISKNELGRNIRMIRNKLSLSEEQNVIPISALKRTGQEVLLGEIEQMVEA